MKFSLLVRVTEKFHAKREAALVEPQFMITQTAQHLRSLANFAA